MQHAQILDRKVFHLLVSLQLRDLLLLEPLLEKLRLNLLVHGLGRASKLLADPALAAAHTFPVTRGCRHNLSKRLLLYLILNIFIILLIG